MDWSTLPTLTSLRAFEAAARNKGYSAAGRELNVSHVAVAQQVRALEAHLGIRLASRAGRGIALTPDGAALADDLRQGFGQVAEAVRKLTTSESQRPIHITMTPAFAMSWFMPRLQQFRDAHPEIDLVVNPTAEIVDVIGAGYDVAIRYGSGDWPELESEPLVESNFVIVGASSLIGGIWKGDVRDLVHLPWLQEAGTDEIGRWIESQGIEMPPPSHITDLPGYMLLQALRDGQGIGAMTHALVKGDVDSGRLVILYENTERDNSGYHLVWRRGIQRPALKVFLRWVRQAARDGARA